MSARLLGLRAAIVDLDGTMVDTAPDFLVAINQMRAGLGLADLAIDDIKRFVGKGTENLIRRVLETDYSVGEANDYFNQAQDAYLVHYRTINGCHSTVYEGVREGLELMRANGLRLACVTNKPQEFALELLRKTALADFFEVIYGGDALPSKKPDPMPLLQVCRDFKLQPHQVVAIGDSSNDALAARAAGCAVLTVPYGYNHGEPIHAVDCDGIVASLRHAAELICTPHHA